MKKTILAVPACLALMSSSADAALILEFHEVGSDVVLTFSGEVNLLNAFRDDNSIGGSGLVGRFRTGGIDVSVGGSVNNFSFADRYAGTDLLTTSLTSLSVLSSDAQIGFAISSKFITVGSGLVGAVMDNDTADLTGLSANIGGALHGKSQTFNTSFAASGLDTHTPDTLIDMWRVTGTTGTDNLIQFRVNTVPEPSSTLLCGIAGLGLLFRRNRRGC